MQTAVPDRPPARETTGAHRAVETTGIHRAVSNRSRHRRSRISLRLGVIVAVVVLLATTSAVAYAGWNPFSDPNSEARGGCATNGSTCSGHAPQRQPSAGAKPGHTGRSHPPAAGGASPSPTKSNSAAAVGTAFAPYVDMGYYPAIDLAAAARSGGIKHFNLAFVVAGSSSCTPTWGGSTAYNNATEIARVRAFRAAGGDIRVSFGGESGTELATVCGSASELAAAYQKVITAFSATKVDFDVEGSELSNTSANDMRNQAISILQKNAAAAGRSLNVSYTLPVGPTGLTAASVSLLNSAASDKTKVDIVNIMAMDYGDDAAPNPTGRMGTLAIQAMQGTQTQLKSIFGLSNTAAWRSIAVTPLIGVNEPSTEVFTVSDATKLQAFAKAKQAAFVSMWSISRDKPCGAGVTADAASDSCAGEADTTYDFTKAFLG